MGVLVQTIRVLLIRLEELGETHIDQEVRQSRSRNRSPFCWMTREMAILLESIDALHSKVVHARLGTELSLVRSLFPLLGYSIAREIKGMRDPSRPT